VLGVLALVGVLVMMGMVAMDLGYENPAAFTIMFKRAFGSPPLAYLGLRNNRVPTGPA
jgi:transcriptional regulator GlxA family with amidase domain